MSLFTGNPNPGYLSYITFTPTGGSTVTLPCHTVDYDVNMEWQRAPVFDENGFLDHSKGLSSGTLRGSGIWDTGLNVMENFKLGTAGNVIFGINLNPDQMNCSTAKLSRWHVNSRAEGQVTFDVEFILDNEVNDFDGDQFNDPSVS